MYKDKTNMLCDLWRLIRPTEAARALRKKIKHGGSHQQYRAIVVSYLIIKAVKLVMYLCGFL